MENKRGFYFKTPRGNTYYYDDITGYVNSIEESKYPVESLCYGTEIYETRVITAEEVEQELENQGYEQLTLIVTHECNIRCKYCAYSGEYDNYRKHTNINMDFEIAKRAVLMYFNYVRKKKLKKPLFVPEVSFYGGEPLLNFDLIEKTVEFIKNIYEGKVRYNLTTNACLLDKKKMKFFAENEFILSISLNGYKEEHDRLRVYPNGKGTYSNAMNVIHQLNEMYPEYFRERCYVIGVYDTGTDLEQVEQFFEQEELLKNKLLLYAPVIDYGTKWYEQYTEIERERFKLQIDKLRDEYIENIKTGKKASQIQRALFGAGNIQIVNRMINCSIGEITRGLLPNVGACIPGHKLAVDPYGVVHACEKVNDKMPFGTVDEGINFVKIAEILNEYNDTLAPVCINCPISRFCPHCYQALLDDHGDFDLSRLKPCSFYIEARREQMIQFYDMLEDNVPVETFFKYGGEKDE